MLNHLSPTRRTGLCIPLTLWAVLCLVASASGQTDLVGKNLIGARLGPWFAEGFSVGVETENVRVVTSSTAIHLEFFYLYKLAGPLYLDVNLGAVSRGDIRVETEDEYGFGTAGVYPLGFGLQWIPLATRQHQTVQPFVAIGGSLVIGTETLSFVGTDDRIGTYIGYGSESREALGWYAGGGLDLVLGQSFALSFMGKYQHAHFGKELVGVKDYSGGQVLIGAAYLYR